MSAGFLGSKRSPSVGSFPDFGVCVEQSEVEVDAEYCGFGARDFIFYSIVIVELLNGEGEAGLLELHLHRPACEEGGFVGLESSRTAAASIFFGLRLLLGSFYLPVGLKFLKQRQ